MDVRSVVGGDQLISLLQGSRGDHDIGGNSFAIFQDDSGNMAIVRFRSESHSRGL